MPAKKKKRFKNEKVFRLWMKKEGEARGWLVSFTPDMSFSTPGVPDLTLIRDRIIFAELKCGYNKPTAEQCVYINTIGDIIENHPTAPIEVYVLHESETKEILSILE